MKIKCLAAAFAPAAVVLAACGSGASTSPVSAGGTTPPSAAPPVASTSARPAPSATPLSFYAAQYERISKACDDPYAVFAKAGAAGASDAALIATAKKVSTVCQEVDKALLRATWPDDGARDIRFETEADAPVEADLGDLADNAGSVAQDALEAEETANVVRADLGLPAD